MRNLLLMFSLRQRGKGRRRIGKERAYSLRVLFHMVVVRLKQLYSGEAAYCPHELYHWPDKFLFTTILVGNRYHSRVVIF